VQHENGRFTTPILTNLMSRFFNPIMAIKNDDFDFHIEEPFS